MGGDVAAARWGAGGDAWEAGMAAIPVGIGGGDRKVNWERGRSEQPRRPCAPLVSFSFFSFSFFSFFFKFFYT
jgi:hypothetical protein